MTTIANINPYAIDISKIKKLDIPSSAIRKLSDKEIAELKKIEELRYTRPVNLENHVSQKIYAEVKVNGKTVATLYNSGAAMTSNNTFAKVSNLPSMSEDERSTGPELAQKRAEEIAKALGGSIVKASTAVTQAQFLSAPPIEFKVDYAAMERDRAAAEGRVVTPKTSMDAQVLSGEEGLPSAVDEFLEFTSKSWQEKVRALILSSLDVTEEELVAMAPEEREKLEAKIRELIEAKIREKTGIAASVAEA